MKGTYVTGASGFLGSHLLVRLESELIDTQYTTIPHALIPRVKYKPFIRFFFCSTYGNMIWHDDFQAIIKANVLDVEYVSRFMDADMEAFVFVSSSSVQRPFQTTYARAKRAGEEVLLAKAERYNYPVAIIRPFAITGVGEQREHLIPTLIRSCMTGEKIKFAPKPRHDFIDVEDVVSAMMFACGHKGVFEVGSGISYSNEEVKDIVESITGKKANIEIVENLRPYDTRPMDGDDWVSNDRALWDLGWKPKKTLALSIKEMVEAWN